MKKFDMKKIFNRAWNFYKNSRNSYAADHVMSWSECLRESWKVEKIFAKRREMVANVLSSGKYDYLLSIDHRDFNIVAHDARDKIRAEIRNARGNDSIVESLKAEDAAIVAIQKSRFPRKITINDNWMNKFGPLPQDC